MKRIIITILVIVGSGALLWWVLTKNKAENEAKTAVVSASSGAVAVTATDVSKESVNLDFSANGNFVANQDLRLLSEGSGRVTRILVQEGSRVSQGQVLVHIDAEYASLDLQRAEDALEKLKVDQARYKSSFETGGVTKAQLDDIDFQVRNTENQLAQAKRRLSDSYVRAPISGIINSRSIEVGAYVSPGTELFEIVDVSRLKLQANANESQVVNIKVGDKVAISSTVFPDQEFSGTVSFIAPKADNSLNYPLEITVDNTAAGTLRAGMYGTATFKFPEQAPALVVPRSAFVGSVSNNQVYVISSDTTAVLKSVTPGRIFGERVEVLSGIEEGDIIITSGQINLKDGVKVNPQIVN